MNTELKDLNLSEMSDEDIGNLNPYTLKGLEDSDSQEENTEEQSAADAEVEDTTSEDTGGAGSEDTSSNEEVNEADAYSDR